MTAISRDRPILESGLALEIVVNGHHDVPMLLWLEI